MEKHIYKILIILIVIIGVFTGSAWLVCENLSIKSEIASTHKALAHRELITRVWADRYNFLRYQLSATNIRVSTLENESQYISSDEIRLMYRDIQEGT